MDFLNFFKRTFSCQPKKLQVKILNQQLQSKRNFMKSMFFTFTFLLIATSAYSAPPKKVCNELKVTQCNNREDCSWIKKSTRKDGTEVKAHCRKKPTKK